MLSIAIAGIGESDVVQCPLPLQAVAHVSVISGPRLSVFFVIPLAHEHNMISTIARAMKDLSGLPKRDFIQYSGQGCFGPQNTNFGGAGYSLYVFEMIEDPNPITVKVVTTGGLSQAGGPPIPRAVRVANRSRYRLVLPDIGAEGRPYDSESVAPFAIGQQQIKDFVGSKDLATTDLMKLFGLEKPIAGGRTSKAR